MVDGEGSLVTGGCGVRGGAAGLVRSAGERKKKQRVGAAPIE